MVLDIDVQILRQDRLFPVHHSLWIHSQTHQNYLARRLLVLLLSQETSLLVRKTEVSFQIPLLLDIYQTPPDHHAHITGLETRVACCYCAGTEMTEAFFWPTNSNENGMISKFIRCFNQKQNENHR